MTVNWTKLPDGFKWVKSEGGLFDVVLDVSIWKIENNKKYADAKLTGQNVVEAHDIDEVIQDVIDECFQAFQAEFKVRAEADAKEVKSRAKRTAASVRIRELLAED